MPRAVVGPLIETREQTIGERDPQLLRLARGNDLGAGSAPSSARSIHMIAKHRSSAAARVAPGGLLFLALAMCGPTDAMVDDVQAGQVQPGTQAENAGNYVV